MTFAELIESLNPEQDAIRLLRRYGFPISPTRQIFLISNSQFTANVRELHPNKDIRTLTSIRWIKGTYVTHALHLLEEFNYTIIKTK